MVAIDNPFFVSVVCSLRITGPAVVVIALKTRPGRLVKLNS